MRNFVTFILILSFNISFGQNAKRMVESFVNDVILSNNFSPDVYQKYIHHYNGYSPADTAEFNKYINGIQFLTINSINSYVGDKKDIRIIDITANKKEIKNYIQDHKILPSYKAYAVFKNDELITVVVLDKKDDIVSFFSNLTKTDRRHDPHFLTVNHKDQRAKQMLAE